jgi:hypothetical protein
MQVNPTVQPRNSGRAPPLRALISIDVHACLSCGESTTSRWFCLECQERARPHRDDDPYDILGGEGAL